MTRRRQGKKFAAVVRAFKKATGITPATVAGWADRASGQRYTDGTSTPPHPAFLKIVEKIPREYADEWAQRFRDAWDEDNTPPHVWADYVRLRNLVMGALRANTLIPSTLTPGKAPLDPSTRRVE